MIDYQSSEITTIMPCNLISPEVEAVSFALAEEKKNFLRYSAATGVYAALDQVSEEILDLIALELNTQYYDQTLPREKKEGLISQTLLWYMHGGTPSILIEFLSTILAGGYIEEWYEYGGNPFFFKTYAMVPEDEEVPEGYGKDVIQRINIYKNARSWLESLAFILQTEVLVEVAYECRLEIFSDFFARNNRAFLLLDGMWKLDGTHRLNGYQTAEDEFYPVVLDLVSGVSVPVRIEDVRTEFTTAADVDIGTELYLDIIAGSKEVTAINECMSVCSSIEERVHTDTALRVEKNLWYLDGTCLLDGTKTLNAEILEFDL